MTEAQKEAKRRAEVMLAFSEGREIEIRVPGASPEWQALDGVPRWKWEDRDYRIKPDPTSRPWGASDVPAVCWIRWGNCLKAYLVSVIDKDGIYIGTGWKKWDELKEHATWSFDLKTWRKCEVET